MSDGKAIICKGCWKQMRLPVPIRGPFSIPFRMLGVRPSRMNPNMCTICETMFTKVKKSKQVMISATILFADLRGYTTLSEGSAPTEVVQMLHGFYDECAAAVWDRDGIVNKFIGDAVLAIFNFPITRQDHVLQAVLAAIELQERCAVKKTFAPHGKTDLQNLTGIGIGIHTGQASIGEVGSACKDFTIIGSVVNTASRIQSEAAMGEVLVTDEVYAHVKDLFPSSPKRICKLKGIDAPVTAYAVKR
jgi:adenylate cyclase